MALDGIGNSQHNNSAYTIKEKAEGTKKGSGLTIARALADGSITFEESRALSENYAYDVLTNFYKGNISEDIKQELLNSGFSEKEINKIMEKNKQIFENSLLKNADVKKNYNETEKSQQDGDKKFGL